METPTRDGIFKMASQMLRQEFLSLRAVPHAALRGGEAEDLIRRFLQQHLPRRFDVGAGFIIDPRNTVSRQTDVIVYDALNCPIYRASENAGIFPANNVAAVLEVKSTLDSRELNDGLDKIASVKSLSKVRSPHDGTPRLDQTLGVIFAFDSAISTETITKVYADRIKSDGLGYHADIICVLDKAVVTLVCQMRGIPGWAIMILEALAPDTEGAHLGIGAQVGVMSLDVFFRLLLAHLTMFRSMVDHPGFAWQEHLPDGKVAVRYLTSITHETDPAKREQLLQEYAVRVQREFSQSEGQDKGR